MYVLRKRVDQKKKNKALRALSTEIVSPPLFCQLQSGSAPLQFAVSGGF
jgi:hypothetical protein